MPYVPSEKTVPPAEDRKILDPVIEVLAKDAASKITDNSSLIPLYKNIFCEVACELWFLLDGEATSHIGPARHLARTIYDVAKKYGYWGAHQGELNYSITRFIQRVPQIMVEQKKWLEKDELRYWVYASTTDALISASRHTEDLGIGVSGVFEDIKDEYKWKVNRPYEIAQVIKSGDCYDAPYYMRIVEIVDEDGRRVSYLEIPLPRSDETLHKDVLDYELVLRKKTK
ncbi:MAG: hypothetical protein A3G49_02270 [Candidatus Sungbacteria bacterium RIFCSPLOWO2_12_FULL_41_11]|uniref:Uncharacterized protein n=1 Tax=Candidatus Sungbacteria bacterium RIFCSPLOWO2_12_FULL_41_11 TaxID=1802286 RepID=A0A1G2LNG6_9BACT|nr:MAG: hypothetical protein UV01_C0004G0045 [Parcubacteria group bacterium GW2011_GWA2_42_14]OGZ97221.1 MAG: hypothetical protein A3D41_00230 [Candidatus Sungbacteria bacterium RIFCSPHIGHO2_02_FULL_41_12b]OHA13167.1 MAG: hypothetical protein A3G49_02270 [Candidatus Sungbacteria bacterium RIFCSPLOWO2_12_FULL_41_11]